TLDSSPALRRACNLLGFDDSNLRRWGRRKMSTKVMRFALPLLLVAVVAGCLRSNVIASEKPTALPKPAVDEARASLRRQETVVIAGGCFWGIQAVFQHVKGVVSATSGYSGGISSTAEYEIVSTGQTGHAESVKVVYDPSQVTFGELLQV